MAKKSKEQNGKNLHPNTSGRVDIDRAETGYAEEDAPRE